MRRAPVNLASRPIERVRAARRSVAVAAVAALLLTAGHVVLAWWVSVPAPEAETVVVDAPDTETLLGWEREVDRLAAAADPVRARSVSTAVGIANEIVSWRGLPWGALFSTLEEALPPRARLELVQPASEASGAVRVSLIAVAGERAPLQELLLALESQSSLSEVYPVREEIGLDGLVRMTIQARFVPVRGQRQEATP